MTSAKSENTSKAVATVPTAAVGNSGDIVLPDGTTLALRKADEKELTEFLFGKMVPGEGEEEASESVIQRMVSQVLAGQTADEIFGAAEVYSLRDKYLDRPFTILDVTWYKSDFDEGPPMFMVMKVANSDGQIDMVSTGATMPMAMVYTAQKRGVLSDKRVMGKKNERPTKKGFYPVNLVLAD